ncbi:hypothetical protein FACS1894217_13950 [Clostridia bacterium]|nr:hypothetical protein FACS1894217_13950 [Clostridia bacterium]
MATSPVTVNRITGMSSGMDTDALVKAMSGNQQLKIDQLLAKKTTAEWKSAQILENNNLLRTIKDDFLSALGSKSMTKTSAYNTYNVGGFTNPAVSIRATTGVTLGAHRVEVSQLATAAKLQGGRFAVEGRTFAPTGVTLKDIAAGSQYSSFEGLSPVELTNATGEPMLDADGNAVMGYEFKINGKAFQFKEGAKITDVMDTINRGGAGVKMSFSQLTGSFTLESTTTGAASALKIEENESNFFAALGLDGDVSKGQDARIKLDGYEVTNASNSFTIDGISLQLNNETTEFSFNVSRDTSAAVNNIKEFITAFNDMMAKLDTAYRTKPNSSYSPLTAEAKESMTEEQIKEWETEAQKGLLYRDNNLEKLLSELRTAVTSQLDGGGLLSQYGIKTTGYKTGESFRLDIDEEKLTAALETDPDALYTAMAKIADKTDSTSKGGVLTRITTAIDKYTANVKSFDIQNLRDSVLDYTKRVTSQQDKLYDMQDRLYKKFAAFEEAMSKLQAQSSNVASYFG